jgi:adenylate cyclase
MPHPRYKRYFRQILPFGVIWLIFGLAYVFLELGLIGRLFEYPSTGNRYDFHNSLISVSIAGFFIGLIQGTIEVFWLKKQFVHSPFWKKILFKGIF